MRLTACLLAAIALTGAPALVRADPDEEPRARTAPRSSPDDRASPDDGADDGARAAPDRASDDRRASPVPRESYSPYPRSAPAPRRRPPPPRYVHRPHAHAHGWWGWGWGWGYYPIFAPPPPPRPPADGEPSRRELDADRVYTRLNAWGAGKNDGYMAGLSLALDSRYAGFDLSIDALAREQVTGRLRDDESDPAAWGTAHLTWSVLSSENARIRVLTGASMLSLPDSPAVSGQPWAGKTLVGPDVGVSGQLGLAGPISIEGHARLTPFPVLVADTYAGVAVHGGPLGFTAGWRWVDVQGSDTDEDAPKLMFRGPQVGLSLRF